MTGMEQDIANRLNDLAQRCAAGRRRFYARQPQPIGKVLGQVVLQKRYACRETATQLDGVWVEVVGPARARRSKATGIRRGKLEVLVAHSALLQELSFEAQRITAALRTALPGSNIEGVKFRVGRIPQNENEANKPR